MAIANATAGGTWKHSLPARNRKTQDIKNANGNNTDPAVTEAPMISFSAGSESGRRRLSKLPVGAVLDAPMEHGNDRRSCDAPL